MADAHKAFSEETNPKAKVILIVEDDDNIGNLLEEALRIGTLYQPVRVADGLAALKLIHSLKPDLIIIDYQLPHMNGLDLYDHLRTISGFEEIPVLFMTASTSMPWDQIKRRKLAALSKPFKVITVLQTIEKLLTAGSVDLNS